MNEIPQPEKHSASSNIKTGDISGIENFFGLIGAVIRSLSFSLAGMLFFMAYRFFEVQTLFYAKFPQHLTGMSRELASNLVAVVFIIPTLLFLSNSDKLKNILTLWGRIKGVSPSVCMAWITFFINLFFWEVWVGSIDLILFKVMISIITAYFDYTFSELFNKKFQDWLRTSKLHQSFYALETKINNAKTNLNQYIRKANELKQKIQGSQQELSSIEQQIKAKKQALEQHACPYCLDYIGENHFGLNKHLGTCKHRHREKVA